MDRIYEHVAALMALAEKLATAKSKWLGSHFGEVRLYEKYAAETEEERIALESAIRAALVAAQEAALERAAEQFGDGWIAELIRALKGEPR
jgi:hypothetical protein